VVATTSWILVFGLVFLTTLYFGGARNVVAGPAYLMGACLWLLLGFQAVVGIIQKKRSVDLVDLPVFLFLAYAAWATWGYAPEEYQARLEWLWASVYGAVFLTARHQLPGRMMVPWLLGAFLVAVLLSVAYGFSHFRVFEYQIGPVSIFGFPADERVAGYAERMSGTFGCPNNFGNYTVQAGLVALTLLTWPGMLWPVRMAAAWSALAFAAATFFSISRGSWISFVSSHFVWLSRWLIRGPLNWLGRIAVLIVAAGVLYAGFHFAMKDKAVAERWIRMIGKGEGIERLFTGEGNFRIKLFQDGIKIWQTSPIFGTGPASFDLEHQRAAPPDYRTRAKWTHNDYINTLSDYGIVGFSLVALFWLSVMTLFLVRARSRHAGPKTDALIGLGWAVCAAMLTHAFVDFNFHIPSTAISCFLILGLATATTWGERSWRWSVPMNVVFLMLALGLAGFVGWTGWRTMAAWKTLPAKPEEAAKLPESELAERGERANRWDPRSPELAALLGDAYRLKLIEAQFGERRGKVSPEEIGRLGDQAIFWYAEGEKRSPKDDTIYIRRATVLDLQGKFAEAGPLYLRGLEMRPYAKYSHLTYGNHLARKGDLEGAKKSFEKVLSFQKGSDINDPETLAEAQKMLDWVKERIAGGPVKGQAPSRPFNPYED
jgi:O-antigen ligase